MTARFSAAAPNKRGSGTRSSQTDPAVRWAVTLRDTFLRSPTRKASEDHGSFFSMFPGDAVATEGGGGHEANARPFQAECFGTNCSPSERDCGGRL